MIPELRAELLRQLRNPTVEQETGGLRTDKGYCATGLILKIAMEQGWLPGWYWTPRVNRGDYRLDHPARFGSAACIPCDILPIVGLTRREATKIEEWNDGAYGCTPLTFAEIAAKIEESKIGTPETLIRENRE